MAGLIDYKGAPLGPRPRRTVLTVEVSVPVAAMIDTAPTRTAEHLVRVALEQSQGNAAQAITGLLSTALECAAVRARPEAGECLEAAAHLLRLHTTTQEGMR